MNNVSTQLRLIDNKPLYIHNATQKVSRANRQPEIILFVPATEHNKGPYKQLKNISSDILQWLANEHIMDVNKACCTTRVWWIMVLIRV